MAPGLSVFVTHQ